MNWVYYGADEPNDPTVLWRRLFNDSTRIVACDIETISLKDRTIVGIGLATDAQNAFYFPTLPVPSPYLTEVLQCLNNPNIVKIFHNGMYDLPELQKQFQVTIGNNIIDSLVMAQLCNLPLALSDISIETDVESWDMRGVLKEHKAKSTLDLPPEVLAKKCCLDVQATWAAYNHMVDMVDMDYVKREMELIPILIDMQSVGLRIDHEKRLELAIPLAAEVKRCEALCKEVTDNPKFNPGSYKQVGKALLNRVRTYPKNVKVLKMVRGGVGRGKIYEEGDKLKPGAKYTTDEKILSQLDDPLAKYILDYRGVAKEKSTYVDRLEGMERIYTHFSFITDTRRLASKDDALQNWPKPLRAMLVPDGDYYLSMDYSQQELRVLAYVSNDRVMKAAFDSGADIHAATASYMFDTPIEQVSKELRSRGKTANFAVTYGSTDPTLMGVKLRWLDTFKEAAAWIEEIQEFAVEHMKVPTIGGAWLYIKWDSKLNEQANIAAIKRKAVDYVCQGSAAELTKEAMRRCKGLPMVLQIHDELLYGRDVREELDRRRLDEVGPFSSPTKYELLSRWG